MGAYFRIYKNGEVIKKILLKKNGGSPYPTINDFNEKILLITKHLGEFVVDTKIIFDGKSIRLEQPIIDGRDLFKFLQIKIPERFHDFIQKLDNLYSETGLLLDLLNDKNILVTKYDQIKIVDIWPLFFKKRLEDGDINEQSYEENLERFNFLKSFLVSEKQK